MNTYLLGEKVRLMRTAKADFFKHYAQLVHPFTPKDFFYFFVVNGLKYVHKESLRFVYSNADTYTKDISPTTCKLSKDISPVDVVTFLEETRSPILPKLVDSNDEFLVFEYITGDAVTQVNSSEFHLLQECAAEWSVTPFYNSMAYNLVRSKSSMYLVDLKHFDQKDEKPFFIYMYNQEHGVNTLYAADDTLIDKVHEHLNTDYPFNLAEIIRYGKH